MSSWQAPLAKLVGLIILLPFGVTYLHLYHFAYWKNEYCFVGPHTSIISGKHHGIISSPIVEDGSNADNQIRGDEKTPTDTAQLHGIYAPMSQKKKNKNNDRRQFIKKYTPAPSSSWWFWSRGWPSITKSSTMISSPSSQLSNHRNAYATNSDHFIGFDENEGGKRWCLQSSSYKQLHDNYQPSEDKWCSDPLPNYPDETIYLYPPSGDWKVDSTSSSSKAPTLTISCPTPTTSKPPSKIKPQNKKQNQNVQFILNQPATTLLLLLNTGLAFYYWNYRINPSSVCKQYTKIVIEHEWWRGLTGATAHFEPLHIGFNMMSLHTLGNELEGGFGSIVFLVYNIALVVFTTMVMMAMVYARLRWIQHRLDTNSSNNLAADNEQQQRLRETSSVGYSAVLFAWMVVSTMERNQQTCPIPFFSDVCFSTYSVPGLPFLKFNISPIVSLFVAQFIMPRVSFMGHLAGIVCGFLLHWGVIPPLEICSPNVLFGGVFLLGLIWRRRVIPVRPLVTANFDEEGCVEHEDYLRSLLTDGIVEEDGSGEDGNSSTTDPFMRSKQKKKERELNEVRRKQKTLISVRNLIGFVALASLFLFDWSSSLILSQCLLLAIFAFATQSSGIIWAYTLNKETSDIIQPEKDRSGMIWRGVLMLATLSIVVDSMSVAGWLALPTFISAEQSSLPIGLLPVSILMFLRIAVNLLSLVLSSKILHDYTQIGGGIFIHVFAVVIRLSKMLGDQVFISKKPLWTAFEGRGFTLGRSGS